VNVRRFFVSLVLLTALSARARAEIASTELLGDQANLMSGAVTASTRGGASIWYNPSRLSFGSGESFTFAVSGVGFAYRHYNAPNLIATSQGSAPATSSEVLVLPRASTLVVRASDNLYWGVGLFTPARQDIALQAGSSNDSTGATAFNAVAMHVRRNSLHTMGSLSWKVNDRLLLGAGLAFVTYSYFQSLQTSSARYDATTSAAMAVVTQASQRDNYGYGLRATIGMSLRLGEHWQLAASLAAPTWLFYTNTNNVTSQSTGLTSSDDLNFAGSVQQRNGGARERPEPGVGRFGLAFSTTRVLVELDAEVSGGASSSAFNVDAPAVGNMHASDGKDAARLRHLHRPREPPQAADRAGRLAHARRGRDVRTQLCFAHAGQFCEGERPQGDLLRHGRGSLHALHRGGARPRRRPDWSARRPLAHRDLGDHARGRCAGRPECGLVRAARDVYLTML
jgi:hypothetical protein